MTQRKRSGPHPVDVFVGARVKTFRTVNGLSQTALAERIGITFQQLQKYETGANRVSCSRLVQIAEALGEPVYNFFPGTSTLPVPPEERATRQELELVRSYKRTPPAVRRHVLALLNAILAAPPATPAKRGKPVADSPAAGEHELKSPSVPVTFAAE